MCQEGFVERLERVGGNNLVGHLVCRHSGGRDEPARKYRATARERIREQRTNTPDTFAGHQAKVQEATIDEIVEEQMEFASAELMTALAKRGPRLFSSVLVSLLQAYMLRETNVKDICVNLAKAGTIENTRGSGNRKPRNQSLIKLTETTR